MERVQAQKGEEEDRDHVLDFRDQVILPLFLFIFSRILTFIPILSPCPFTHRIFDHGLISLPEVPLEGFAYYLQGVILLHALSLQLSVVLLHDFLYLIGVIFLVVIFVIETSSACL